MKNATILLVKKVVDICCAPLAAYAVFILSSYLARFIYAWHFSFLYIISDGQEIGYPMVKVLCGLLAIVVGGLISLPGIGAGLVVGGAGAIFLSSFNMHLFMEDYTEIILLVPAAARLLFFGAGLGTLSFVAYARKQEWIRVWAIRLGIVLLLPVAVYAAVTVFVGLPAVARPLKKLLYYYYRETFNLLMVLSGIICMAVGSHNTNRAVGFGIMLGALFCLLFPLIEVILGRFH